MYNTQIQTTLSIMGHLIFIEYEVTPEWAVEWYLTDGAYDNDNAAIDSGIDLLDVMLRAYHCGEIETKLITEFESRKYEEEQKFVALTEQEDVTF